MRITIGYPDHDAERRIITEAASSEPVMDRLRTVLSPTQVLQLQERVDEVDADEAIVDYLMTVVARTRTSTHLRMGVSPRGAIALYRAARAFALTRGRTYLVPDDVRELVVPCLAHRILPAGVSGASLDAHQQSAQILESILEEVEAPV
jgi:MoxR-like ATPase